MIYHYLFSNSCDFFLHFFCRYVLIICNKSIYVRNSSLYQIQTFHLPIPEVPHLLHGNIRQSSGYHRFSDRRTKARKDSPIQPGSLYKNTHVAGCRIRTSAACSSPRCPKVFALNKFIVSEILQKTRGLAKLVAFAAYFICFRQGSTNMSSDFITSQILGRCAKARKDSPIQPGSLYKNTHVVSCCFRTSATHSPQDAQRCLL